ncbi:galactokinase [Malassezia caprae]|uniref:Galactokinase n=1 Tax=Malassezia caprae TaxID=1381934 RepID=A0AAF0IV74_9BASI|nr:galactokinase [Malassezia caprae]
MPHPVPVLQLPEVYSPLVLSDETERVKALGTKFEKMYHHKPAFIARAPGRLNMIGEHIDTSGYSVFPMAIERDVLMAASYMPGPGDLRVVLANVASRFSHTSFSCDLTKPESLHLLTMTTHRWANYFMVALRGLLDDFPPEVRQNTHGVLHVLVDGTIPPESSLSSSAAMTTASSLVVIMAFGMHDCIDRKRLTEKATSSERLIGVSTGGMDQAASVFGEMGKALYVSFAPTLHTEPIQMPKWEEYLFLITNTLIKSDKKANAPTQYNLRVVELRIAAYLISRELGVQISSPSPFPSQLRAIADAYWEANPNELEEIMRVYEDVRMAYNDAGKEVAQLQAMLNIVEKFLPRRGLTREELEQLTGLSSEAFHHEFLSQVPVHASHFYPHHRAFHVYSEAQRVLRFRAICDTASKKLQSGEACDVHGAYVRLGHVMNESHESLRNMYDCSCPELDLIVHIGRQAGALGSRLTGAGWGGSAVHLVPRDRLEDVKTAMRNMYYSMRIGYMTENNLSEAMFVTDPTQGACYLSL